MYSIGNAKFFDFDWDEGNRKKCKKHGVTNEEIEFLILSSPDVFFDEKHSSELEERFLAIGQNHIGRHLMVVFTLREKEGEKYIRPISARYMHKKEVDYYEKENPDF